MYLNNVYVRFVVNPQFWQINILTATYVQEYANNDENTYPGNVHICTFILSFGYTRI